MEYFAVESIIVTKIAREKKNSWTFFNFEYAE